MILRANVVVPSIVATFAVALVWTHSPVSALGSIFNASFVAAKELFNIFLVIALITSLLNALKYAALRRSHGAAVPRGDDERPHRLLHPFRRSPTSSRCSSGQRQPFRWYPRCCCLRRSSPACRRLPAQWRSRLPVRAWHLSSDYVIGVAPGISAKAAGAAVSAAAVADRALSLSLITGGVALVIAYFSIRKLIQPASEALLGALAEAIEHRRSSTAWRRSAPSTRPRSRAARGSYEEPLAVDAAIRTERPLSDKRRAGWSKLFAILTPLGFAAVIAVMVLPKLGIRGLPELKGGDAAALVGGMGAALMILATLAAEGARKSLDVCADHITDGFVFAFKAMGSVLPIAGFFFMGAGGDLAAGMLNVPVGEAPPLLFNLIQTGARHGFRTITCWSAFGVLIVGMITGVDGSGFAGLPLTGSLSGALGPTVGLDVTTLCAVGQMGAVWTGGGTLIAWSSLIAVAGFARVSVLDTVRALLLPVLTGLFVSTICAVLFWS